MHTPLLQPELTGHLLPQAPQCATSAERSTQPKIGPQIDRQTSCPEGGPTSLKEMVDDNHDYRGQWGATAA